MSYSRGFFFLAVLALFVLFPFFEGGETASGIFSFNTITLLALAAAALVYSRLWIPRFLAFFLPFLLVLVISTIITDYRYAAFLKLWDYFMGGLWAILICTIIRQNKDQWQSAVPWIFCAGAGSAVIAIIVYDHSRFARVNASFLNPNEYATFALLLLCLGIFCLERETNRSRKILLTVFNGILLISVGLSWSRGIFIASLAVAIAGFLRRKTGKAAKILLLLLVVFSGIFVAIRFQYYNDPLKYYRWKIWKSSVRGIANDPYFGTGLGMLQHRAPTFNFPAETELGRYARLARSADSQYVQVLAETGFLGLLSFLFGWINIYSSLRKTPDRFFYTKQSWLIVSIVSLFSVPLENTSVLFLLMGLIVLSLAGLNEEVFSLSFSGAGRILIPVGCFVLFVFGSYLPFQADRQFNLAVKATRLQDLDRHLALAVRYNPYQPYYKFVFIKRIVEAKPQWTPDKWLSLTLVLDQSIELNPAESEFYLYKARIFRILLEKQLNLRYYSSAISSYQAALDRNPYNVFLRLEFATFLYNLKRYNLAESELRNALEAEPAFLNARLFLTELLITRKNTEEARKEYETFLDYYKRFRKSSAPGNLVYIRSLLEVNETLKLRVESLLKAG